MSKETFTIERPLTGDYRYRGIVGVVNDNAPVMYFPMLVDAVQYAAMSDYKVICSRMLFRSTKELIRSFCRRYAVEYECET